MAQETVPLIFHGHSLLIQFILSGLHSFGNAQQQQSLERSQDSSQLACKERPRRQVQLTDPRDYIIITIHIIMFPHSM